MTTATIFLPWPDKRLSPNGRYHWTQLARAKKAAKRTAHYTALEAGLGKLEAERLVVRVSFYPPDRRPRDTDNMVSSCKAFFDGISQAIGIDDSKWTLILEPRGAIEKNGMVKVVLDWTQAQEAAA